tara:strand:+ start:16588 stop:17547 length:960 start_codon:yes stop_codon:yes gene_type:complete
MNRPDFVIRLIKYYNTINFNGKIYIGDSSSETNSNIITEHLKKINFKNVKYFYLPNQNIEICQQTLAKEVKEDFIVFSGDDDFFIPNSLQKSIEFLKLNQDYSVCHGNSYIFKVKNDYLYGKISYVSKYKLNQVEHKDPNDRFLSLLNNYWVSIFSVHRTSEYLLDLQLMQNISLEFFREKVLSMSSLIRGKSKSLNINYLYRQVHNRRYANPKIMNLVLDDNFNKDLVFCSKLIAQYINKYGGNTEQDKVNNCFKSQISSDIYNSSLSFSKHLLNEKKSKLELNIITNIFKYFKTSNNNMKKMKSEKIYKFINNQIDE